jgi:hypothetical protein
MPTFIKTGYWERASKGLKGWLNLDNLVRDIASSVVSTDEIGAIKGANSPSPTNPFATMNDVGEGGGGVTDILYNNLVSAIDEGGLVEGSYYRITDFATVHWMTEVNLSEETFPYILDEGNRIIHTGANEPLIVIATSSNTISTEAWSATYPQDIIKYDWNPANWSSISAFVDSDDGVTPVTGFKGVIIRREDTLLANKVNFDYREITYRLWNIEQTAWDVATEYNAGSFVQYGTKIYYGLDTGTGMEPETTEGWESYWRLLLDLNDGTGGMNSYVSFSSSGLYNISIDNNIPIVDTSDFVDRTMFADDISSHNQFDECTFVPFTIFGTGCSYNSFGIGCSSNTFGTNCSSNTFGTNCYGNTFGTNCSSNTFGTNCYGNTFGTGCYINSFGTRCSYNSFGTECYFNTFGTGCYINSFGTNCYGNTFGTNCSSNTFGTNCSSNTFGTGCSYNSFGTRCSYNSFGTRCYYNSFGTECSSNTFGTECYFNTFPNSSYKNELKDVHGKDYTLSTPFSTNASTLIHQMAGGNVYQTYIDVSGTPALAIVTDNIGVN